MHQQALAEAARRTRWLVVNVQEVGEWASQVLNRDVWKDPAVATLLELQCVFWQVARGAHDADRFAALYRVERYPVTAVVDPRTHECVRMWYGAVSAERLVDDRKRAPLHLRAPSSP